MLHVSKTSRPPNQQEITLIQFRKQTALLVVALFCAGAVYAQEIAGYRIENVDYDIKGRTREYPLSIAVKIDKARVFPDTLSLKTYVDDIQLQISNQRVLESANIDTIFGTAYADGIVPVFLTVHTVDTWNVIAVPYPKYDSNTGLQFKIKLKDYDFLGSMQTLTTDVVYQIDSDDNQSHLGGNISFSIPFEAYKYPFVWDIAGSVDVPFGEAPEVILSTGLDCVVMPFDFGDWHVGITQGYNLFVRDDDEKIYTGDEHYATETVYTNLPVILYRFERIGKLYWTPSLSVSANLAYDGIQNDDLMGPDIVLGHSISLGRIDWIENFRNGFNTSISNSYTYDSHAGEKIVASVSAAGQGYVSFFDRIGLTSQFTSFYYFNDKDKKTGKYLRGIVDDRFSTDTAFILNVDIPVRIIRTHFEQWTNMHWTRLFEFELQAAPFVDMALTHDQKTGRYFALEDGWCSGGLELLVFPDRMRSIYGRVSVGYDLRELYQNKFSLSSKAIRDGAAISDVFFGIGLEY
jgi:hypothetical protein